ncbi:MAG: hypothetical protein GXX79_13825 [Actinomycetales bacterium]|nr:hypothetical protein [Actinomycetales bacterium]
MRLARARDGFCRTHLSTFGPTCTRCASETARRKAIHEQLLAGELSSAASVEPVPERARVAEWVRVDEDADETADCL